MSINAEVATPILDRTIHEPARLNIMILLSAVESVDFLYIMHQTGLTFGNLSSHLSKLETAGYVRVTKEFVGKKPHTLISITPKGAEALRGYTQQMQQMLKRTVS
jgi:DNA-binding MarR family transcriptional regulator